MIVDDERETSIWRRPNDILVHDMDLFLIINELKAAGAEVISVNGTEDCGHPLPFPVPVTRFA